MRLETITYEEERAQFFQYALRKSERRYKMLAKKYHNAPYTSDQMIKLSDAGRELGFYQDIVRILSCEPDKANQWIKVGDRLPDIASVEKGYGDHKVDKSVRVLCACRQKSGNILVKEGYYERWDFSSTPCWRIPGNINEVTHWMPLPQPPCENQT